jgi:hypothetical protein
VQLAVGQPVADDGVASIACAEDSSRKQMETIAW